MAILGLNLPPDGCPNDGACLTLASKLSIVDQTLERHEAALVRIGKALDDVKENIHTIHDEVHGTTILINERAGNSLWLRNVSISLIILGITNLAAGTWWASKTSSAVDSLGTEVVDIEARLREVERRAATFHDQPVK